MSKNKNKGYIKLIDHIDGRPVVVKEKDGDMRVYIGGIEETKYKGRGNTEKDLAIEYAKARVAEHNKRKDEAKKAEGPTATEVGQEQTKDLIKDYSLRNDFMEYLKRRATEDTLPLREVLTKHASSPELWSDELREKYPNLTTLPDDVFNYIYREGQDSYSLENLENIISGSGEKRSDILDNLKDSTIDERENRQDAELNSMINPEIIGSDKYAKIWDRLSEEDRSSMTPEELRKIYGELKGTELENLGQTQATKAGEVKGLINTDPTSLWDTVNNTYSSPLSYDSDKPFNKKAHQLGIAGHNFGSTSQINNTENKFRARDQSDFDNKMKMFDSFMNYGVNSRNDWFKMNDAERRSILEPYRETSAIQDKNITRDADNEYRQDVFKKDIAQGEINLENQSLNDRINLEEAQAKQRDISARNAEALKNKLEVLGDKFVSYQSLGEQEKRQMDVYLDQFMMQKEQLAMALERQGWDRQQIKDLRNAKKKEQLANVIGSIVKIGGAAALAIGSGGAALPAAIGMIAPEAGAIIANHGYAKTDSGFLFGNDAKADLARRTQG